MSTATKTKKTYVVLHPDGTYSTRTSTRTKVYTAAVVKVTRLAQFHDIVNVRGARTNREWAAEYRATAGDIRAGLYVYEREAPFTAEWTNFFYINPQTGKRLMERAKTRAEADAKLDASAATYADWAEKHDRHAARSEAISRPEEGAVEYGGEVMYRSDPAAADAECDRLNRWVTSESPYYWMVAGVHLVPAGTKPAEYAKALQVPF